MPDPDSQPRGEKMDKKNWTWNTQRLPEQARVVRWGHFGTPVLLFPTAGGDYEEVERFHMVRVLGELIDAGRIKVYSIDSVAGKTWLQGTHSSEYCSRVQNLFDSYIYNEVVPLIREDCGSKDIEVVAADRLGQSGRADVAVDEPVAVVVCVGADVVARSGRQIVDAHHRVAAPDQPIGEMRSDEAGAPCKQHVRHQRRPTPS